MISSSAPQWQIISLNINALIMLLLSLWTFRCSRYDESEQWAWMM
jgi:hypothetical protein